MSTGCNAWEEGDKAEGGYVLEHAETCSNENQTLFITSNHMGRNVVCDVEMLKGRLSKIMGNTDTEYLYRMEVILQKKCLSLEKRERGVTLH